MIKNVPTPLNNGYMPVYVCVYVCVKERERGKEVKRVRARPDVSCLQIKLTRSHACMHAAV